MGGGCFHTLRWCAHSGTSGTHRHTLCLNPLTTKREQLSHPRRGPRDFPGEAVTTPLAGKGWVSGALLPPPHRRGAAVPVAQMCGARREATAGGFPAPSTPAGPSSFMSLPSRVPARAEQLRPAPHPQPLSQLSLGWGRAAGEQLQGKGGGGTRVPPETAGNSLHVQVGCRGPQEGKAGGLVGSSAPPPVHLARPAESPVDPRSKPPPGFKGHPEERGSGELPKQRRR